MKDAPLPKAPTVYDVAIVGSGAGGGSLCAHHRHQAARGVLAPTTSQSGQAGSTCPGGRSGASVGGEAPVRWSDAWAALDPHDSDRRA